MLQCQQLKRIFEIDRQIKAGHIPTRIGWPESVQEWRK